MADDIRKWFDEEIKWADDKLEQGTAQGNYYLGYEKGMQIAKGKLLREGVI